MSAFVDQVYCRNADSYTYSRCSYNKNNGTLSWNMTMNINPLLVVVIIYDSLKDTRNS